MHKGSRIDMDEKNNIPRPYLTLFRAKTGKKCIFLQILAILRNLKWINDFNIDAKLNIKVLEYI